MFYLVFVLIYIEDKTRSWRKDFIVKLLKDFTEKSIYRFDNKVFSSTTGFILYCN